MIYIATASRRGSAHPDQNEDSLYFRQTDKFIAGGVFDGCSSGKDSYFASKLFAIVFRKTLAISGQMILNTNNFQLLVKTYFSNLSRAINVIGLCTEETLSTAVLFLYEIDTNHLLVKFFGDGVAYANNQNLESFVSDEDNKPDYIGYKLEEILQSDDFENYWHAKKTFDVFTKDFSIATDGIFSFRKTNENTQEFPIESYLAQDDFLKKNPASLKRKLNIIRNKGYDHYDDVSIIRVQMA